MINNLVFVVLLLSGLQYQSSAITGGHFTDAVVKDSCLYVADGRGIRVFNQRNLAYIGSVRIPGNINRIEINHNTIFASGSRGLIEMESEQAVNPEAEYGWIFTEPIAAMAVGNQIVYFSDSLGGLYSYDISSDGPVTSLDIQLPSPPVRLIHHNSNLFAACDADGLFEIDLSGPDASVKKLSIKEDPPVDDILFSGDLVYLACWEQGLLAGQLKRNSVKIISTVESPGQLQNLVLVGDRLFGAAGTGDFVTFLLTDPQNPTLLNNESLRGQAQELALSEQWCFVLSGDVIQQMNIRSHPRATVGSQFRMEGENYDMDSYRSVAVVASGGGGVKSIMVGDSLEIIGSHTDKYDFRRIYLFGPQAYTITSGYTIQVIDAKDPAHLARRTYKEIPTAVTGIDVINDMALAAEQEGGVGAWWRCPCGPLKEQGRILLESRALDVQLEGKLAFVSTSPGGLHVIDWSDSSDLVEVTAIDLERDYERIFKREDNIFALDSDGGLAVINVHRPTKPKLISTLDLPGAVRSLAVGETRIYVAAGDNGVYEVDISDLSEPVLVDTYDIGPVRGVSLSGDVLLVATPYSVEAFTITQP